MTAGRRMGDVPEQLADVRSGAPIGNRSGARRMLKTWMFRLGMPVIGRFHRLAYPAASLAGWIVWLARPRLRRRVVGNLMPACSVSGTNPSRAGRQLVQNVARYYVDIASLRWRDLPNFERDHIRVVHRERLGVLEEPGPVVAVSAHFGSPELIIRASIYRGRPFVALVETLEPPALNDYLLKLRREAGGRFMEADLGGVRECLRELHRGGLVVLMGDRDLQGNGICVTLFGRRVRLPRGPWELARRTGAPVLPVLCARLKRDDIEVTVEEPIRVRAGADSEAAIEEAAQAWACLLERHVARAPGQWTVLEDFWSVHRCGES